jgi:hypothetical protein
MKREVARFQIVILADVPEQQYLRTENSQKVGVRTSRRLWSAWTPADDLILTEMTQAGKSTRMIKKRLNRSSGSIYSRRYVLKGGKRG